MTFASHDAYRMHALNADGIFFQERVSKIFKDSNLSYHTSEYGVSTENHLGSSLYRESRLDLWFRYSTNSCLFNILAECKKADPLLKEWIFIKDNDFHTNLLRVDYCRRGKNSSWSSGRFQAIFECNYALSGKELKGNWDKKGKADWKTATTRIDEACDQISIANYSIRYEYVKMSEATPTTGGSPHFLIPIIVTNASLFLCELNQSKESHQSEIELNEASFKQINSVVIRHPLSPHLRAPMHAYEDELSKEYVSGTGYRDILIVNPEYAVSEVQKICEAVSKEFKKNL